MAVSPSGNLLATGQIGTVHFKGYAAPIFLWDVKTQQLLTTLRGLTIRVNAVEFSTDERFVCAVGEVNSLHLLSKCLNR